MHNVSGEAFRSPWLVTAASVFASASEPLYAVGGLVRNDLMALPASDVDVCGPARPERVLTLCEGTPVRANQLHIDCIVAVIRFVDPQLPAAARPTPIGSRYVPNTASSSVAWVAPIPVAFSSSGAQVRIKCRLAVTFTASTSAQSLSVMWETGVSTPSDRS